MDAARRPHRRRRAKLLPVLSIGIHDPTLGFTDAFFHTTAQRQQEVAEAAFADPDPGD